MSRLSQLSIRDSIYNFVTKPMDFLTIAEHLGQDVSAHDMWIALAGLVQDNVLGGYNGTFYPKHEVLGVVRIDELAIIPEYKTQGAACFDIYAISEGVVEPGEALIFDTGLKFEIPVGFAVEVYSRSGHGFKDGIRLSNCVGQIDHDYKGELKVSLFNDSSKPFTVKIGDRIAQAKLVASPQARIVEITESQMSTSARGTGGFGSTGS